jgi:predicted enzyme related to lactoylglutathione lyase
MSCHDHGNRSRSRTKQPGAINGGFFPKQSDKPAQYPSIVIAVDNMAAARDRVTRAGGRVLGEPMEIPDVGTYVSIMDPEGNRVAMLEPTLRNKQRAAERKADMHASGSGR